MMGSKDIPTKYVWRKNKWYRNGRIAYKGCPSCFRQVSRNDERCVHCNQMLDWNDYEVEHPLYKKIRGMA